MTVGAGAGLGAIVFRYLILWFAALFSGHEDYSGLGLLDSVTASVIGRAAFGSEAFLALPPFA